MKIISILLLRWIKELIVNHKLKLALVSCMSCFPAIAFSGEGTGLVEIEYVGNFGGKDLLFFFTTTHTAKPSCNSFHSRWVIDISTALGKSQYSLLLAAQTSGKEVRVLGQNNNCDNWFDTETANVVGYVVDYAAHP